MNPKVMTIESFKAEYPAIAEQLLAEGRASVNVEQITAEAETRGHDKGLAEGKTAGAEAERARIQGVLQQSLPGHEKLVNTLAFDGSTTPEAAASAVLKAERQARTTALGNLQNDAAALAAVQPSSSVEEPAAAGDEHLPIEERCQKQWDSNATLRTEFASFKDYLAFSKAEAAGKIKVLGKKSAG